MTKEIIKHQKEQKKKPTLTPKERKAKKKEKKMKPKMDMHAHKDMKEPMKGKMPMKKACGRSR